MSAPTPIARNSCIAASEPRWPALWISLAATDSGKGSDGSSTITRRRIVTMKIPRMPPRIISDDDSTYCCHSGITGTPSGRATPATPKSK